METRIEQLEAEAEASAEMSEQLTGDTLARRLEELQASSGLDLDLLELKDEMGLLPRQAQTAPQAAALPAKRRRPEAVEDEVPIEAGRPEPARASRSNGRWAAA